MPNYRHMEKNKYNSPISTGYMKSYQFSKNTTRPWSKINKTFNMKCAEIMICEID